MEIPLKTPIKRSQRDIKHSVLLTIRTVYKTVKYIYERKPMLTLGLVLSSATATLFPILETWLVAKTIDALINQVATATTLTTELITLILLLVVAYIAKNLVDTISWFLDTTMQDYVEMEMEHTVSKKMAYLDVAHYDNPKNSDLIIRVADKYRSAPFYYVKDLIALFEALIRIFSGLSILFVLSPLLILVSVGTVVPELIVNLIFNKKNWNLSNEFAEQRRDAKTTRSYIENESNLQELRIFRLRDYILKRYNTLYFDWLRSLRKLHLKQRKIIALIEFFTAIGNGFSLIIIIVKAISKVITVGSFTFYTAILTRLQGGLYSFFYRISSIYERGLYMDDIFNFLDLPEIIVNGNTHLADKKETPTIEFRNVSFAYPNTSKKILSKFNLKIESGEHLAVVGENGAGKTTIIKLLMRFYDVDSGEILIDGINIKELDLDNWYTKVGTLFQDYNFYHFDAKTNIGVGNIERIKDTEGIIAAAKEAGAHDFIQSYEKGYDQVLNKKFSGGINPSTGQKQRIALARAFFKNAPVLILDEPTSAIDPKAEFEIFDRLFKFAQNKTVVIVSHRFSTVRNAARIIVVKNGKIAEQGTHDELMTLDGIYKKTFEIQKRGYE